MRTPPHDSSGCGLPRFGIARALVSPSLHNSGRTPSLASGCGVPMSSEQRSTGKVFFASPSPSVFPVYQPPSPPLPFLTFPKVYLCLCLCLSLLLVPVYHPPSLTLHDLSSCAGWFTGLSSLFLGARCPKLLLLAGTDRLDRDLTIAQMQGKFQMNVVYGTGHILQEDSPDRTTEILDSFFHHHQLNQPESPPSLPLPLPLCASCGVGIAMCPLS